MTTIRMVGQPGIGTGSGTKVWAFNNIGMTPVQLVGVNPYREFIQFANPGTVTIFVTMEHDANGVRITPSVGALGGTIPVVGGAVLTIADECQTGWQGVAAGGSANPLTVYESNLN